MDGFLSTTNLYLYRNIQISSLQIDYQQIADLANFRQIDNEQIANLKIVIYLKNTKNITIMYARPVFWQFEGWEFLGYQFVGCQSNFE